MPRNVATLVPRCARLFPSRGAAQARVAERLAHRYRYRMESDPTGRPHIEIDFPKSKGRATAKDEVAAVLDGIDPRWRRWVVSYPTENSLRQRGERG